MALIHDTAVTLRRLDYSETSQVVVFFTREHGKVRAIAKGIKRSTRTRHAVGLDLLEAGDVGFSVRQARQEALATLTEWKQRLPLSGLRERLARFYAGQYLAEITAALTEDWDPHPELYDGLLGALGELCGLDLILAPVVVFQGVLLREAGAWPELGVCVACRRPPPNEGDLYFSSFEGGLLCRDCEAAHTEKRLVDRRALASIGGSDDTAQPDQMAADLRKEMFALFDYHLSHLMGKAPLLGPKVLAACE